MSRVMQGTALIVPTLNASVHWPSWFEAFAAQTARPEHLVVVDSSSNDDTRELALAAGFAVHVIDRADFNHGGTRQLASSLVPGAQILIYMTQDAIFASADALERIVATFDDERVGAAYGRQLPRREAHPIEAHARLFNYDSTSRRKRLADAATLGIKTAFLSDSFAAYRRVALDQVGGFPVRILFGEDSCVAGKMVLAGWETAYVADAEVYHSHSYSFVEEFRRYFDIGVFHSREGWLRESFGSANGEGLRFVRSELAYLKAEAPTLIPSALLRTAIKLGGYHVGLRERFMPAALKARLSMFRPFWRS